MCADVNDEENTENHVMKKGRSTMKAKTIFAAQKEVL